VQLPLTLTSNICVYCYQYVTQNFNFQTYQTEDLLHSACTCNQVQQILNWTLARGPFVILSIQVVLVEYLKRVDLILLVRTLPRLRVEVVVSQAGRHMSYHVLQLRKG
jgi:hypothetical protein